VIIAASYIKQSIETKTYLFKWGYIYKSSVWKNLAKDLYMNNKIK